MSEPTGKYGNPNWVKGMPSPNPGGMSITVASLRKLFATEAPRAIQMLFDLARTAKSEAVRLSALEAILDRAGLKGYCVEPEKHSFTGENGEPLESFTIRFVKAGGAQDGNPKPTG